MSSAHDYHIAAEPDVSGKANRKILYYFFILGVMLVATMVGLTIMYRFQVEYEKEKKIGDVFTAESVDQIAMSESYLSGKRGLFDDKKHVPVNVAMDRFISDLRKER